jgi:predicted membrane-bound spermidine synthase
MWLLYFVLLPALEHYGLAPMLRDELATSLLPLMLGFAGLCGLLQALVLVQVCGWRSLWRDLRGQVLLATLLLVAGYFAATGLGLVGARWQAFCYLAAGACGLVLLLQLVPGES